ELLDALLAVRTGHDERISVRDEADFAAHVSAALLEPPEHVSLRLPPGESCRRRRESVLQWICRDEFHENAAANTPAEFKNETRNSSLSGDDGEDRDRMDFHPAVMQIERVGAGDLDVRAVRRHANRSAESLAGAG